MFGRITKRELFKILRKNPTDLLSLMCTILLVLEDLYNIKIEDSIKAIKEVIKDYERD